MSDRVKWLALGYNIPINPSKNRVYIWRKLKEYGAEYFKQGVALLPYNKTNLNRFSILAAKIRDMGGDASLVEMSFLDKQDELDIIEKFRQQSTLELGELKADCFSLLQQLKHHAGQKFSEYETEQLKKVVKRYSKAKSRDHFSTGVSEELDTGMNSIMEIVRASAEDFAAQLAKNLNKTF